MRLRPIINKVVFPVICFSFLLIMFCLERGFAAQDRIVAVVNGEAITQGDVDEYLASLYFQLVAQYDSETAEAKIKEVEPEAVNILIENKLMVQEARKQNIEIPNDVVDRELENIKARFSSENEFDEGLLGKGLTLADFKNKIYDKIIMHEIVKKDVRSKIFVHPQEVTDYYNEHLDDFKASEQVDLDSIFIPFSGDEESSKKTADEVYGMVNQGADFDFLKEKYSKKKSLGLVSPDHLKQEIKDAISGLNETEVSMPVKAEDGFYILKIKKIITPEVKELSRVRDVIYGYLFQKKFEERFSEWLDSLKSNAFIIIK